MFICLYWKTRQKYRARNVQPKQRRKVVPKGTQAVFSHDPQTLLLLLIIIIIIIIGCQ